MPITKYVCEFCKKEFLAPSWRKKVKTCSKRCLGNYYKQHCTTKIILSCKICNKQISVKKSSLLKNKTEATCSRQCAGALKSINYVGNSNPNKKIRFDENYLSCINSKGKAWLLGWICSDGSVSRGDVVQIAIHKKDKDVLDKINSLFNDVFTIKNRKNKDILSITLSSKKMVSDIQKLLKISTGKKSSIVSFPDSISEEYKWDFIRGVFEGDGTIRKQTASKSYISPECSITSNSKNLRKSIEVFTAIPCKNSDINNSIAWYGVNCLDFLAKLYDNTPNSLLMDRKAELYYSICLWEPKIIGKNSWGKIDNIRWVKTDKEAIAPSKQRASDSGYDLSLIKIKDRFGKTTLYDTGIRIIPPFGFYFDLVPRSSIIKTGYILGNSVGIIDRNYLGNILVPLIKIDDSKPDLELPIKLVQLIPREIVHCELEEVEDLELTARNDKGFGSSGK